MNENPKKIMIEMVGRLGRETQLHLDEREHHFEVTDIVLRVMSLLMIVLAIFNVYYIHVLYQDLNGIVSSVDSMHTNLRDVKGSMTGITSTVKAMDQHMLHMDNINTHTGSIGVHMPQISATMRGISGEMFFIEQDMGILGAGMMNIDQRFGQMTNGVATMRENMYQISRPMSFMNPIMP